jgi:hypothetical protein
MKTVVNNLVWMALVSLMVCASIYPGVSSVAQAVIWVIVAILLVIAPLGLAASVFAEKAYLIKLAGTKKGFIRRLIGWTRLVVTFSAIAYAGFTVAAIFYLLCALMTILSVYVARDRLKDIEKEAV